MKRLFPEEVSFTFKEVHVEKSSFDEIHWFDELEPVSISDEQRDLLNSRVYLGFYYLNFQHVSRVLTDQLMNCSVKKTFFFLFSGLRSKVMKAIFNTLIIRGRQNLILL